MTNATCAVAGCDRKMIARGYCGTHYARWKRGADLTKPVRKLVPGRARCEVGGCNRAVVSNGLCTGHNSRRTGGRPIDNTPLRNYIQTDDLSVRLRHYAPPGATTACWNWTAATNKGYGMITIKGSKLRLAHVVSWELHHDRKLPKGMAIRHDCDNPLCVNPAHLQLGTHGDNNRDKAERNRVGYNGHGFSHLRPHEVREIRVLHEQGINMTEIARRFGRSRVTIIRAIQRRTFPNIA